MGDISKNFNKKEFTCKCGCGECNIDMKVVNMCQTIRDGLKLPITINSGYRCIQHNSKIGGVPNSYHTKGCAADILVPDGWTVDELADLAEQCGADGIGRYYNEGFVHVDTRGYPARF